MKLRYKIGALLGAALFGAGWFLAPSVEAGRLDTYRQMLAKKSYTIRYFDVTPAPRRVKNRDKTIMYGRSAMNQSETNFLLQKQTQSIVVCSGDKRYEETAAWPYSQCRLQDGDRTYCFSKYQRQENVWDIFGKKKGVVEAQKRNRVAELMYGEGYGSEQMTRYLNAILPEEQQTGEMPHFSFVDSGMLDSGLGYEDYSASYDGLVDVVRYYFQGSRLVKIAAAVYGWNEAGEMEGTKFIARIEEFSSTPDQSYLKLPEGVEDKTQEDFDKEDKDE